MKKFNSDWFSNNIPKFNSVLDHLKNKKNISLLEVGSFEGRSTCWFIENICTGANSTITCIDTWEGSMEQTDSKSDYPVTLIKSLWDLFNNNISEYPKEKVIIKRGLSRDRLRDSDLSKYDFIYVDGSHTTRDVLGDAVLCFDLLKIGGVMTFDDYLWTMYADPLLNPRTGIDAFLICYRGKYELLEQNYQVTIKKISG